MYIDSSYAPPDGVVLETGNPEPSTPFFTSQITQPTFLPETDGQGPTGVTLNQNDYIDWAVGGQPAPVHNLGWTESIIGWAQKNARWAGQILIPSSTLSMLTSQQYGDVGRDNRNQVLVAQYDQQYNAFLPDDQTLAYDALQPGYGAGN